MKQENDNTKNLIIIILGQFNNIKYFCTGFTFRVLI